MKTCRNWIGKIVALALAAAAGCSAESHPVDRNGNHDGSTVMTVDAATAEPVRPAPTPAPEPRSLGAVARPEMDVQAAVAAHEWMLREQHKTWRIAVDKIVAEIESTEDRLEQLKIILARLRATRPVGRREPLPAATSQSTPTNCVAPPSPSPSPSPSPKSKAMPEASLS